MKDDAEVLALIPTLRVTFDALGKHLPNDPMACYARDLLAKILKELESRGSDITPCHAH